MDQDFLVEMRVWVVHIREEGLSVEEGVKSV